MFSTFKIVEERGKNTKEVQVVSLSCLCKHMDNEVNGTSFQPDEIKHRQCFLFVSVICDLLFLSTFITKPPVGNVNVFFEKAAQAVNANV